jgi:hypothetical protein
MMTHTTANQPTSTDRPSPQRKFERVREWEHMGKPECPRRDRPVFTAPGQIPEPCGTTRRGRDWYACGSEEWRSKGIVLRDQNKRVINREKLDL